MALRQSAAPPHDRTLLSGLAARLQEHAGDGTEPAAAGPGAGGSPTSRSLDTAEVERLLASVVVGHGWCGGRYWRSVRSGGASGLQVAWRSVGSCGCRGDQAPTWCADLPDDELARERVVWRAAELDTDGAEVRHAGVVAPVLRHDDVVGRLAFHGALEAPPDESMTLLLTMLATTVGDHYADLAQAGPRPEPPVAPDDLWSLAEVFTFTLEILPRGRFRWVSTGAGLPLVLGGSLPAGRDLNHTLLGAIPPEDLLSIGRFHTRVAEGLTAEAECRVEGLDGQTRWVRWRGVPRRVGERTYVDGVATDVTARRQLLDEHREVVRNRAELDRGVAHRDALQLVTRQATDDVLQHIFGAGLGLHVLQRHVTGDDALTVARVAAELDLAVEGVRRILHGLEPGTGL